MNDHFVELKFKVFETKSGDKISWGSPYFGPAPRWKIRQYLKRRGFRETDKKSVWELKLHEKVIAVAEVKWLRDIKQINSENNLETFLSY